MISCFCGRTFKDEAALLQHQADRSRSGRPAPVCQPSLPGSAARSARLVSGRENWMWKGVEKGGAIESMKLANLEPSATLVSSVATCEFLCSYNWQNCRGATVQVPGA